MAAASQKVYRPQYHHYIPRFMLRRFSSPPSIAPKHGKKRNRKQREHDIVTAVSLNQDDPEFITSPVGRIFGQFDMYKDDSKFSLKDQVRIETKLCVIEEQASRIIARVADAHKAGYGEITLSRLDKDLLRKFIFVMKYRSPIFFARFNHQTAEDYHSDDRTAFLKYMQERDFQRPLDVWFDNLLKIIDKDMDPAGKWTEDLWSEIYPGDAIWLYANIRSMWLSFATPSDSNEEFILTDNAFGIHEGPVDCSIDPLTGKQTRTAYTEFHVISVISPHLVMILRHNLLPEPLEDQRDDIRNSKKESLAFDMQAHSDPDHATSLLEDLPVAKARNSYTVIQNGRLELAKGADKVPRAADRFTFTFFRLESRHAQMINLIMLDQAHHSSNIVFKSKVALRAALDFYLDFPTQAHGTYSLKTITERPDDPMLLLFRKLEKIAHSLGSSVKARYHIDPLIEANDVPPLDHTPSSDNEASFDEIVAQVLQTANTDYLADHLADTIIALPSTVLLQTLDKLKMNVMAMHALDQIHTDDDWLCYPDSVFQAVQKADTRRLNARTKALPTIGLSVWRRSWDLLVMFALQLPGVSLTGSREVMRSKLPIASSLDTPPALVPTASRNASRDPRENVVGRSSFNDGIESASSVSGWSRQGLRKAFDDIGRDVHDDGKTCITPSPSDRTPNTSGYHYHRKPDDRSRPRTRIAERGVKPLPNDKDVDKRNAIEPVPSPSARPARGPFPFALFAKVFTWYCVIVQTWRLATQVWHLIVQFCSLIIQLCSSVIQALKSLQ
jgi:hypothetical protein